jgi:ribonucleoside-diphosphate reductase alpha subunit
MEILEQKAINGNHKNIKNNANYEPDLGGINSDDEEVMYVITRTGKKEPLDTNQITRRLQILINRPPKIQHVNAYELMLIICKNLRSGVKTSKIDEYAANASASLGISNPNYLKVAARIAIDNHQKNTIRSFIDKMRALYLNKDENGRINSLISADFMKYVEENQDFIETTIDYNRDYAIDFFGFQTFLRSYSMRINDEPIERPQDMFMRTAIDLHMKTKSSNADDSINGLTAELANIKETYDMLSNKLYTHASPTYYNAGSTKRQYASCFLLGTEDSREGIMRTADHISEISKGSGGIGVHINCWRGEGARIRGTNGRSSGVVPWLKIYNEVMRGFNQGGRRPGSAAFYMMPHHPDIMKFIEINRNGGSEETRARDIFTALWIPDIFMERVLKGEKWSLFDPDICGDLSDYTGDDYRSAYLALEAAGKYCKQLPARDIWKAAMDTNIDAGRLYICFADNANRAFMQKNLGVLKSSNLCSEIFLYSDSKEYAVCILSSIALPSFVFDAHEGRCPSDPAKSTTTEGRCPSDPAKSTATEGLHSIGSATEVQRHSDLATKRELNHEFPVNPYFDYKLLIKVVSTIVKNLNLVIDKTYHPLNETRLGNDRHRPIGIGVQGLDDCYAKMRYPFDSPEALALNKKIFETIYYAAVSASSKLSRDIYMNARTACKNNGFVELQTYLPGKSEQSTVRYDNADQIPSTVGAYPSFTWTRRNKDANEIAAPISKGVFHWELCGIKQEQLSGMFDWDSLREHVKKFGVRNSLLVACMPTASTSQLLGNNECIEPYTSNMYKRNTIAGEYIVFKKYLLNDLYRLGLWSNNLKDYLIASGGSIRNISGIPDDLKRLYPTVWEIDQNVLIQQAIDRQPFVDQGQSLNLYVNGTNLEIWNRLMFKAWRGGLKTGKYYLHTRPAVEPQMFTIDPAKQKEMRELLEKNKILNKASDSSEVIREICEVCSA